MKHLLTSLFGRVTLGLLAMPVMAQVLTTEGHTPYRSDSLLAYKLPYVNVVDSGLNCIWDFSNLPLDSAELITMDHYTPAGDTSLIGLHREHANYYYRCERDTLWLSGYETAKSYVWYSSPLLLLRYPFVYGDSSIGVFSGRGKYCHFMPLSINGISQTKADATGILYLPHDTIDSVLRVHSLTQYYETHDKRMYVREERYQWFSMYCRYPHFETINLHTIKQNDTISFVSSYFFPQEYEHNSNHNSMQRDSITQDAEILITAVKYLPNPVYTDLYVNYNLAYPAETFISLHYNGGTTVYQTPVLYEDAGKHLTYVNMSGLPMGIYVVYIHANDTVVSGNVVKLN